MALARSFADSSFSCGSSACANAHTDDKVKMKMTARKCLRKKECIGLSAELRDCGNKDRQNLNNRQFPMTLSYNTISLLPPQTLSHAYLSPITELCISPAVVQTLGHGKVPQIAYIHDLRGLRSSAMKCPL